MNNLIKGLFFLLLIVGLIVSVNNIVSDDLKLKETPKEVIVKNPSTGESWDSVEDYVYRNSGGGLLNG